jgi:lactate permease
MVLYAQYKAVLQALIMLYMIWAALLLYNVVAEAGVFASIGSGFSRLTNDPAMQMIILAWAFSAFIQGASGFGVPVAVAAPLLIGLGVSPLVATVGAFVGHSWAVTYGSLAMSFQALILATDLSGDTLAPWVSIFIGIACLACGVATVHAYGGVRAIGRMLLPLLVVGGTMSGTQFLLATSGLWTLASFVSGILGVGVAALMARLPAYRGPQPEEATESTVGDGGMPLRWAVMPYVFLILSIFAVQLIRPLNLLLNRVVIRGHIPTLRTGRGWVQPAEVVRSISVFGHPGALLIYTAVFAFVLFLLRRRYPFEVWRTIVEKTWHSAIKTTVGVLTMVGFATLMSYSGMSHMLAQGASRLMGDSFPLVASLIGGLGAFITGSNTNSNFVFAPLQQTTADLLELNALVILAAQTTGGALGSMMAPAKVIVGCSTTGLTGDEGLVLRRTIVYGVLILAGLGVLARILS